LDLTCEKKNSLYRIVFVFKRYDRRETKWKGYKWLPSEQKFKVSVKVSGVTRGGQLYLEERDAAEEADNLVRGKGELNLRDLRRLNFPTSEELKALEEVSIHTFLPSTLFFRVQSGHPVNHFLCF
jgi:hypothetical protein